MKVCRVKLEVELEINAFNENDAVELATECICDMEGLGVTVVDVNVIDHCEI
jgi:hypothetical protein